MHKNKLFPLSKINVRHVFFPSLLAVSLSAIAMPTIEKVDLGSVPSGWDTVSGLSADGKFAVRGDGIYTGENWKDKVYTAIDPEQPDLRISSDASTISDMQKNSDGSYNAVVFFGANWNKKIILPPSDSTQFKNTKANVLSDNGKIIGGFSHRNNAAFRQATLWYGKDWGEKTALDSGVNGAEVIALSGNGKVAGGASYYDDYTHAVIWSGENWERKIELKGLQGVGHIDSYTGHVIALNKDGSIAGGHVAFTAPVIWSGPNWEKITALVDPNDSTIGGQLAALSEDGLVAVGILWRDNFTVRRAVVWSGKDWSETTDLGTLMSDNSGESAARSISADGKIVGGLAQAEDGIHPVIWRLSFPKAVSPENTERTINKLNQDTFALLSSRKHAVRRLTADCQAGNGQFCYSAGYDYQHATQRTRSHSVNLLFGYGIADNLTAGFSVSTPLVAKLNDTHRVKSGAGVGVFARFHGTLENGTWYLTPAVAFDTQKLRVNRPHLMGTEDANNRTKVTGTAFSLTFGQDFGNAEKFLGWYSALRHEKVKRHAYTEDVSAFPFVYDAAKLSETTFALGVKGSLPMTAHLTWESSAEFEQRIGGGKAHFAANAEGLASVENTERTRGFRPSVQTGFGYAFSPATKVSVGGYVSRAAFNGTDKGAFLKVSGTF